MQGHRGEDLTTNTRKTFDGCAEQNEKGANIPKEGEGTDRGKLGGMGMMGGWIEARAHLGIREELIFGSPSGAYYDG
jgi:hypothetical protein